MMTILIAEDRAADREFLETVLSLGGYHVVEAEHGERALMLARTKAPDLIISDVMMPRVDGYELVRQIRADPKTAGIPVLFYSATYLPDELAGLAASCGVHVLTKPSEPEAILRAVETVLREGRIPSALLGLEDQQTHLRLLTDTLCETHEHLMLADITRLKEAEQRLVRTQEHTEFALTAAQTGVWVFDLSTGHITWSESMRAVMGLGPGKSGGTIDTFMATVNPDDRAELTARIEQAIAQPDDFDLKFRCIWPDGTTHWVTTRGRFVLDALGRPAEMVGVATDVTEREELEARLRQSQKLEAIGALAGGIAHDFNNLLTVIGGYARFVSDQLDAGDPRRDDIDHILRAGESAAQLTRQLLAFGRKQILRPLHLDLNELITETSSMLRRLIGEHIDVATQLETDLPAITADPTQIEQILLNLATNARDAMPTGGRLTIDTRTLDVSRSFARANGRPGALRGRVRHRYRHRHGCRNAAADLRAVLHDQGHRARHRSRLGDRVRHHEAERRIHPRGHRPRPGHELRRVFPHSEIRRPGLPPTDGRTGGRARF